MLIRVLFTLFVTNGVTDSVTKIKVKKSDTYCLIF